MPNQSDSERASSRPRDRAAIETAMRSAVKSFSAGRPHETEERCRWILSVQPGHAPALNLLGTLAHRAGHLADAIKLMQLATVVDPRVAEYHSNVGVVLMAAGRFDEAVVAFRRAIAGNATLVDAHFNLGNALHGARKPDEAAQSYRDALALRPAFPDAHNNLGNVLKVVGQLAAAASAYRDALVLQPGHARARSNLASVLEDMGRLDEALDAHRRAVDAAPNHPAMRSNLILDLHYQPAIDADAIRQECRRWNARHAEPLRVHVVASLNDRSPDRPLRIGYVSADLRRHAVASFLLPLLRGHDRRDVHVTCYPTGPQSDDVTQRLRALSDAWRSLAGQSNEAAAQAIRDDRIDVLVDLGGHTENNRLTLFARRPAPVQITYLGFPGTTGVEAIDGRVTDAIVDPIGFEPASSERPLRIAPTAWCFEPPETAPPVAPSPCLRHGWITFGSFNALKKINPVTIALWAAVLARVPTSRLVVKNGSFRDPEVVDSVLLRFVAAGIDPHRIDLLPETPTMEAHLQAYERVDIALDPFPYHGTTTTCEALWMGVPVVTLAGQTHASRVGASLLSAVGLSSLVAGDAADYTGIAARLSADEAALDATRQGMRERLRASPLLDARHLAARFEAVVRGEWHAWCRLSPR